MGHSPSPSARFTCSLPGAVKREGGPHLYGWMCVGRQAVAQQTLAGTCEWAVVLLHHREMRIIHVMEQAGGIRNIERGVDVMESRAVILQEEPGICRGNLSDASRTCKVHKERGGGLQTPRFGGVTQQCYTRHFTTPKEELMKEASVP